MTMNPSSTAAATPRAGPPTREYRAIWTFAIAGAFLVLALILAAGSGSSVVASTGAVLGTLLGTAVSLVEARGLSQGRDWARYAMTPMLWVFVGAGMLVFLLVLAKGGLNIPIGGILAAWALSARPSDTHGPVPASSAAGTYLVLGALLSAVIQFF